MISMERKTLWLDLGTEDYASVYLLQLQLSELRREGAIPDLVMLVEHPSCVTLGRGARPEHILANHQTLTQAGVRVHAVNRGGDVTYHGPGQLVCYVIMDLNGYFRDVRAHVRRLEEVMIHTANAMGADAYRDKNYPGAWTSRGKIGAVGIQVRRWVTMHGAALNVSTQLTHYSFIVPCGIRNRPVTSLEQVLNRTVSMHDVLPIWRRAFGDVFKTPLTDACLEELILDRRASATAVRQQADPPRVGLST